MTDLQHFELLQLFKDVLAEMPLESAQAIEARDLPLGRSLAELVRPPLEDPGELLQHRFLCRSGTALMVGPTGVGKSSFMMQCLVLWALGQSCFGITPPRPLRSILIQAENDEGDLAEMRDGVAKGLGLDEATRLTAFQRITVYSDSGRSGEKFYHLLEAILAQEAATSPFDLLVIDPAFAYLGGDASKQEIVSRFMREWLQPLAVRHQIGILIIHHTNKPMKGTEKASWAAGDFAYLGAGSAEWINPARAALAIRSIGSESVFELRAPKRGKRLGWKDANDESTTVRYIAHHRGQGVICWREADPEEVEALFNKPLDSMGSGIPHRITSVIVAVRELGPKATYMNLVRALEDMTRKAGSTCKKWIRLAKQAGAVEEVDGFYVETEKARELGKDDHELPA